MIGAWFGFSVVPGLTAIVTTIIGATIVGNLALVAFDITTDRGIPDPTKTEIDLTEREAVTGAETPEPHPATHP